MKITNAWLTENGACDLGKEWFTRNFPDGAELAEIFTKLDHLDWFRWLCEIVFTPKQSARLACIAARQALRFVPAGETRPLMCIETVEAYLRGEKTAADVASARDAAWDFERETASDTAREAAWSAWNAASAAASAASAPAFAAASAAAHAARIAAYPAASAASWASDRAAWAASWAAGDAAWAAAIRSFLDAVAAEIVKDSFKRLGAGGRP